MTTYHLELSLDDTLYRFQIRRISSGKAIELQTEWAILNASFGEDSTDADFWRLTHQRLFIFCKSVTSIAEYSTDNGKVWEPISMTFDAYLDLPEYVCAEWYGACLSRNEQYSQLESLEVLKNLAASMSKLSGQS